MTAVRADINSGYDQAHCITLAVHLYNTTSTTLPLQHYLNPFYGSLPQAFTYLGHYFYQEKEKENSVGGPLDEDKATKCYIGALKLNPLNEEAGWALSEIYMSKGGVKLCGVV